MDSQRQSRDRSRQDAVPLVSPKILELGSARQVLLVFRGENTNLPASVGAPGHDVAWKQLYNTIWHMLRNPMYAGASRKLRGMLNGSHESPAAAKKRGMSAAGRKAIAEAQRKDGPQRKSSPSRKLRKNRGANSDRPEERTP
jgi:hypothetical protein